MPVLAVNDIMEMKTFCYQVARNQVSVNITHWLVTAITGIGESTQRAVTTLDNAMSVAYIPILNQASVYYGTSGQRIRPLPASAPETYNGNAGAGIGGIDAAPCQLSLVLTKRSIFAGRKHRGRLYVPFAAASDVDTDGLPNGGYVAAMTPLATILITPLVVGAGANTATLQPVIYNKPAMLATDVSNCRINKKFGTQRRRGVYGRVNTIPPF